jgi:Carboxypeptidase regulatory-like domain/TonB-dependent Receptor Plug Domain
MMRKGLAGLILVMSLGAGHAAAQGVQTGAVRGTLTSRDGAPVAGALIQARSSALQRDRETTSDVNGVYALTNLPPGIYAVSISKTGFSIAERAAVVPLGGAATLDVTLGVANVSEAVIVEANAPAPIRDTQTAANIRGSEINALPMGRTPYLAAELLPGVTTNAPNANQVTISGGFAYDNVFLIDGVDVNDNLLGTSNDLFIEDAISEVQVLTSGVTAEYGRFSGGVVNIITRSGANLFAGSYRTNFSRPSWTAETPFERANGIERGRPTATNPFITDKLSTFTELTAGGPIVKDRLWLFGAGRVENGSASGALQQTAIPYTKTNHSRRFETKGTASFAPGHSVQGTFIDNQVHRQNEPVLSFSIDRSTLISPSTPNHLAVISYNGALSAHVAATAQYSQKHFETRGVGGTSTSILDSPFLTRTGSQYQYNAPLFDASDPEHRNNRQLSASLTYFFSDHRFGSHEMKTGYEDFADTRVGANSQTSTGYVFMSNFKVDATGAPVLDASGRAIPVFTPNVSRLQRWFPIRGAEFEMTTRSGFAQDRWVVNPHLTMNLGVRIEHAESKATAGAASPIRSTRAVPRLGATYDLDGDGRTVLLGSYSQYSGKYNDTQFSKNTLAGNSNRYTTVYTGAAGEGRDFAAGFDPGNYAGPVVGATFPAVNILFDRDLSSPLTHEVTMGAARLFGHAGYVKGVYVQRKTTNFVEDFVEIANGAAPIVIDGVAVGTTDNVLYKNSDTPKREYRAVELMSEGRLSRSLTIDGQLTVQLKNDGNFEGETPNPTGSAIGDYPEMLVVDRSAPLGRLDDFQRSKVRVWAHYDLGSSRLGSLTITPLYRYNSAKTYSLAVAGQALSAVQAARNPGYANTVTQTLYFGNRGSESFKGYGVLDLALTYSVPVWRSARPWIKVEAFNALNNQKLVSWDTTIAVDPTSPKDANGLATGYLKGPRFGTATSTGNFAAPRAGLDGGRMLDFSIGFRF